MLCALMKWLLSALETGVDLSGLQKVIGVFFLALIRPKETILLGHCHVKWWEMIMQIASYCKPHPTGFTFDFW